METLKGMFHWKSFPQAALFLWNRKLCKPSKPPACHCLHLFNANVKFLFQEICITCKLSLLIFIFIITVLPDLRVWPFSTQEWPAPNFSSQKYPWINLLNLNHSYWNNDNLWLFTREAYVIYRCKNAERWDWTVYRPVGIDGRNFYTHLFIAEVCVAYI